MHDLFYALYGLYREAYVAYLLPKPKHQQLTSFNLTRDTPAFVNKKSQSSTFWHQRLDVKPNFNQHRSTEQFQTGIL